jgi:hypothetical protein
VLLKIQLITLYILAAFSTALCLRIEYMNAEAEYHLPRRDEEGGKWRASHAVNEKAWRNVHLREEAEQHLTRPLTPIEHDRMTISVQRARAKNALRAMVGSWGLLQYLLCPLIIMWSFALVTKMEQSRITHLAWAPLLLAITCAGFTFYRGYITSLGW